MLTIVSNKAVAAIHAALKHFRLSTFVSIVVGDIPTLRKKPDPMAYNEFIQPQFPLIPPQEILMVGDTPADLGFAHAIGADSCWVQYGYGDPVRCRALHPRINRFTAITFRISLQHILIFYLSGIRFALLSAISDRQAAPKSAAHFQPISWFLFPVQY